jgi:hypothetical protein
MRYGKEDKGKEVEEAKGRRGAARWISLVPEEDKRLKVWEAEPR